MLEGKLNSLMFNDAETIESYDGTQTLNDPSKSYVVSDANITNSNTIVAKNITMDNAELSNNARMSVKAKDVTFNSLNINGDFPKSNGNSVVKVDEAEYVIFKDMTFDSSNVYNGIEIGLSNSAATLPKNIIFENCKFTGTFSNNAILIFATQDNAIITLSNCQFDKVSNVLRLSNRTNAKNVTVNIIDPVKKEALAIVTDDNLSLAIGKKGTNIKLASRLTKYKIEVTTLSKINEQGNKD